MRLIALSWVIATMLYIITPYAFATNTVETTELEVIWTGENVGGELCVEIFDESDMPATGDLWLINTKMKRKLNKVHGYTCLNIEYDKRTRLQFVKESRNVDVAITEDRTSEYVSFELPGLE
ncbi:MAG: hypothetical protein OEX00_09610 [Gammaproteobacteria bacterium]|nr:hypothetical protein [Gammaproteobacteria bacterium]